MKYLLRVRMDDASAWGEPTEYSSRRERDKEAAMCRAYGGFRTHSYEESTKHAAVDPVLTDSVEPSTRD